MSAPGYKVTRSDGVTYPSIAAAAKSNKVAVITIRRSVKYGKLMRNGLSFTAIKPPQRTKNSEERMSASTICPMCGRETHSVTGFCGKCYRQLSVVNRKEDAYRAASVYA